MKLSTYKAPSGQWSFVITDDENQEVVRGAGFQTEEDARQAGEELLASYGS